MYRIVKRVSVQTRCPTPVCARRFASETKEEAQEPAPLSITEENVLTVKRRTRKPRAPKVQVDTVPVVQPSGHKLFTPHSVTTSNTVRFAMLHEIGAKEPRFIDLATALHTKVLAAGDFGPDFDMTVVEGSDLMGIEAVFSQTVPPHGKILVISNGADGERLKSIAKYHAEVVELSFAETEPVILNKVREALQNTPGITNVAFVHCDTSSGNVAPAKEIIEIVNSLPGDKKPVVFADVSNTFGAADLSWAKNVQFLYVAPHKALQGVPGFGLVVFQKDAAKAASSYPKKSFSLDFISQWQLYQENGQVRYTPPTHALVALNRALDEYEEEGGWSAREKRYKETHEQLVEGMTKLGFETASSVQSYFFTYFKLPTHPKFNWEDFAADLRFHGFVVYRGNSPNTFGVSTIGHLFTSDVARLLSAIKLTKEEMKF